MKHFDFPVDALDFIFVEHWDSDDRLHAAKIFNYCFKKYLKSRHRQDILNDVVLFILDDFVRRKKPIIRRKTKPRDLINFLNKDIPNKYFGFRPLSIDAFFLDKKDKDKSVKFALYCPYLSRQLSPFSSLIQKKSHYATFSPLLAMPSR